VDFWGAHECIRPPGRPGDGFVKGVKGYRFGLTGTSLSVPKVPERHTGSSGVDPTLPYLALVSRESARLS
jgi:hypothetical protein